MSAVKLVAGELQLLEQLAMESPSLAEGARYARPTWEVAHRLRIPPGSALQKLRRLGDKGLVRCAYWRGAERWWTLTDRGLEVIGSASLLHNGNGALQMAGGSRGKQR